MLVPLPVTFWLVRVKWTDRAASIVPLAWRNSVGGSAGGVDEPPVQALAIKAAAAAMMNQLLATAAISYRPAVLLPRTLGDSRHPRRESDGHDRSTRRLPVGHGGDRGRNVFERHDLADHRVNALGPDEFDDQIGHLLAQLARHEVEAPGLLDHRGDRR